jgi:hypothetical protein
MKNWILGVLLGLALSIDGWSCMPASEMRPDGEPNFGFVSPQVTQAVADARVAAIQNFKDDGVLYLSAPDPEVQDLLYSVADFYLDHLKVQIAVVPKGGRPVELAELPEQVAGNAHLGTYWCAGSECSNPLYNMGITLDAGMWATSTYTLRWHVLAHEVGHVISGWGVCYTGTDVDATGSHLGSEFHIMSPYSDIRGVWDELDDALVCSCGEC